VVGGATEPLRVPSGFQTGFKPFEPVPESADAGAAAGGADGG